MSLSSHHRATLRLGVPIAIGQVGVIIMGFADTMMVGRYTTDALASASFVNNVFNLINFLIMGYSYGLTPLVGAAYGRGDKAGAGGALKLSMSANGLYGVLLLSIMGALFFFLDHLGQPTELLPLIRPYYLVILLSMLFVVPMNVMRQFTDGTTDTATGMWVLLAGNALNIVGNALLIYGIGPFPELGLLGAGISTLVARFVTALAFVLIVAWRKRYAPYREGFKKARLNLASMREMNAASLPISLQMGMEAAAFSVTAVMAGWLGASALASYQVMVTVGTLGFMFYYSFGAAASIRVATFIGTHDHKQMLLAASAGRNILLTLATLASLTFFFFGEWLIGLFTTDPAVVALSLGLIPFLILYQYGDAMQICYANVLRGTGHVKSMMYIAFVSYMVINLPAAYIIAFPLRLGVNGLFFSFSIGLFVAAALFYREFRKVK